MDNRNPFERKDFQPNFQADSPGPRGSPASQPTAPTSPEQRPQQPPFGAVALSGPATSPDSRSSNACPGRCQDAQNPATQETAPRNQNASQPPQPESQIEFKYDKTKAESETEQFEEYRVTRILEAVLGRLTDTELGALLRRALR
jgi:hypothetical protein